jgi:hypothetical protein
MNDKTKSEALKQLGDGLAAVVQCALRELPVAKGEQVAHLLASGERDLIVSVVMGKMTVVGTLTHPRGEVPPVNLFRIEMNPPPSEMLTKKDEIAH